MTYEQLQTLVDALKRIEAAITRQNQILERIDRTSEASAAAQDADRKRNMVYG